MFQGLADNINSDLIVLDNGLLKIYVQEVLENMRSTNFLLQICTLANKRIQSNAISTTHIYTYLLKIRNLVFFIKSLLKVPKSFNNFMFLGTPCLKKVI